MDTLKIDNHKAVQTIARKVLNDIKEFIREGVSEKEIAYQCIYLLQKSGITDCWYHNVPAFVLVGDRTILSISGRNYFPTDTKVKNSDLVTIDLSPKAGEFWGDCARSFIVESGKVADFSSNTELNDGIKAQQHLHQLMKRIIKPEMELEELFILINQEIKNLGYINLDFRGNLGHSIEKEASARRYIEANNKIKFSELSLFTFEPHIAKANSKYGFKHENIYYFENGKINAL